MWCLAPELTVMPFKGILTFKGQVAPHSLGEHNPKKRKKVKVSL